MDNYSKFRYPTNGAHIYPNFCIPLYIAALCHSIINWQGEQLQIPKPMKGQRCCLVSKM